MFLNAYKPGQGYYTRVFSALGAGLIVVFGVFWINQYYTGDNAPYYQAGTAAGMVIFFGALLWYLLNKPRIADFMIATEAEMKKVNWPSRREVIGSTWVVICGAILMAVWLLAFNTIFGWIFLEVGVLES